MSENPFETPKADLSNDSTAVDGAVLLDTPRKNSLGSGWTWIVEGFRLFAKSPLFWIINIVIYMAIMMLLSFIPLVSLITAVITPVFTAGLMWGAAQVDNGEPMTASHLFEGFKKNTGSLFAVGGLYLAGVVVAMIVAAAVAIGSGAIDILGRVQPGEVSSAADQMELVQSMLLPALIYMALLLPLIMMVWFAPVLIIRHDLGAIEAMKLSFSGCLKNMLPYLFYGFIAIVLVVLGVIPFGLGLLVVVPVLTASIYTAYKAIFLQQGFTA